jgi:single-strand DNA-binding protein
MLNKAILIGNVGKEPEIRSTQDGREIASFSLATSQTWKDKSGERKEKTEWHNIVVFSEGLVRVIKGYVKKGDKLYIEGAIQTRKWVDKEGNDRYSTEIVLQGFNASLVMLSDNRDKQEKQATQEHDYAPSIEPDSIPF